MHLMLTNVLNPNRRKRAIADMERDGTALDLRKAAEAMTPYVDAGFTTFDMADHYGSAEEIVGVFREQLAGGPVELFTKWVPAPGPATAWNSSAATLSHLQRSNRRGPTKFRGV